MGVFLESLDAVAIVPRDIAVDDSLRVVSVTADLEQCFGVLKACDSPRELEGAEQREGREQVGEKGQASPEHGPSASPRFQAAAPPEAVRIRMGRPSSVSRVVVLGM